ncbi:TlpA family protein disulfide reductase [Paucihalobacter ruber]|uniref:TlpA family protein disulfide reductase n=1 Tax=Paucihalobacter ruber TaxID=2567861 RepID=A0A506PLB0_9FLAO|nr:TlpA disulfide reductase family protein [Paucihalobacter ruber]TPV34676.1 TlpA family protein disulfide reductase [Paucihalobacter ruber]
MRQYFISFSIIFCSILSCDELPVKDKLTQDFEILHVDFKKWHSYHYQNIILSTNFKAIDDSNDKISKEAFLKLLRSGEYITLKLEQYDSEITYKLFKLNEASDETIKKSIKIYSSIAYAHFKFEGKKFPDFHFTTLDGTNYTNENVKGHFLIVKCWFINCKPCIAEFPELNELVDVYKYEKDIIFVSLALDQNDALRTFLQNNTFNYETVGLQTSFIKESLKVSSFPTHFIIDKNGIVVKVVNNVKELKIGLKNLIESDNLGDINNKNESMPGRDYHRRFKVG